MQLARLAAPQLPQLQRAGQCRPQRARPADAGDRCEQYTGSPIASRGVTTPPAALETNRGAPTSWQSYWRSPMTTAPRHNLWDNPMGTDGFEFVEYTGPDPQALVALFVRMGFV